MALVKCEEEDVRAIAEAIRLNCGFTDTYKLDEIILILQNILLQYYENIKYWIEERPENDEYSYDAPFLNTIPINITKIKDYCFRYQKKLALTELPKNLTYIGAMAFYGCTNLALTELPENLTYIGPWAFDGCFSLALTKLPESLTYIGGQAFNGCINLKSLTFKGTPQSIGSNAFYNCTNLTIINVPWSEGEVADAPWGATNATINYNHLENY